MRLRRIEAVRYGRLGNATLGDLGDGLTVVLGPNEAGKSTYTSLVRHVLFGYPTAAMKEPGYFVPGGGGRLARLVMEDENGAWVIERGEGTHGGVVSTRTLRGNDRPGLLGDITEGVSALAYRVVFGFGLDEMAAIEEQRAAGDDVLARLYAASAGLRVSPHEVRTAIEKEAGDIYVTSGRKRELNLLLADVRSTRSELRSSKAEAEELAEDQQTLAALSARVPELRQELERARTRSTEFALAVERAEERRSVIDAQEDALLHLRQERKRIDEELQSLTLDESLRAAIPDLEALLEEAPAHIEAIRSLGEAEAVVERAAAQAGEAARRSGLSPEALATLGGNELDATEIEDAREDLQRLRLQLENRTEALGRAEEALAQAMAASEKTLQPLGIVAPDPADAIAERLSALDAIETLHASASVPSGRGLDFPSLVMLVSGLAAVATGVYLREWVTVGIGVVLVFAGAWFLYRSRAGAEPSSGDDARGYLRILGLGADAGPLDLARMRRSLELARTAVGTAERAAEAREEAARDAKLAEGALETRVALWTSWLADRGLDTTLTPGAVAAVLGHAREARVADASAAERREDLERRRAAADEFTDRFVTAVSPFVTVPEQPRRDDLPLLVSRVRERIASERSVMARVDEQSRELRHTDARITAEQERMEKAASDLREILERFDLTEGGSTDDLRLLLEAARQEEVGVSGALEQVVSEISGLEGRLEKAAREKRRAELHLAEAGTVERIHDAVDRYLVRACAARILGEAQERYERERQPEVVREAGRLFSTMTHGRYTSLSVPLDDRRIEAFDAHSAAHTSDLLSRGTAEQLYLAIRLGLIARLGEVGAGLPVLMDDVLVNFDPERRRGAAEAVSQLAEQRQIVFFTCHPETAAVFSEVAESHTVIELDRIG